jgi:D-3-phosphoglycerate dehydrogenase / 2-oxoglutarate reductase
LAELGLRPSQRLSEQAQINKNEETIAMFKVRTYNQISVKGLERFSREHYEVGSDIGSPHAFMLRSQKLQGVEVPKSLLAAARAGAGVNNVPIAEYSKLGVVVFNTPGPTPTR